MLFILLSSLFKVILGEFTWFSLSIIIFVVLNRRVFLFSILVITCVLVLLLYQVGTTNERIFFLFLIQMCHLCLNVIHPALMGMLFYASRHTRTFPSAVSKVYWCNLIFHNLKSALTRCNEWITQEYDPTVGNLLQWRALSYRTASRQLLQQNKVLPSSHLLYV